MSKILLCVLKEFVQDSIVLQSVFTNARERLEQVEATSEEEGGNPIDFHQWIFAKFDN